MNEKEMGGTVADKLIKTLTVNGEEGKMAMRSERGENSIIQVHQCLTQRKNKTQKEKEMLNGSPLGKTNDGRRVSKSSRFFTLKQGLQTFCCRRKKKKKEEKEI